MTAPATIARKAITAMLCLSLAIWSAVPTEAHVPTVYETLHQHLEMIAEHGHSHGLEEDLYWALHGHSHEAADHDHHQVFLVMGNRGLPSFDRRNDWRFGLSQASPLRAFRIERPPRA